MTLNSTLGSVAASQVLSGLFAKRRNAMGPQ